MPSRSLVVVTAVLIGLGGGAGPVHDAARAADAAGTREARDPFPAEGLIGVVYPYRALDLHVDVGGRVDTVAVDLGQRVARGALLVRLDEHQLLSDLQAARAEESVAAADLEMAVLERKLAERRLTRREKVPDAWSEEEVDEIANQADMARAKATRAEASLESQRARVAGLAERLARATVTAPFAGTIARRYVEPGILLNSGDPVVRIISDRDLRIRFGVPEGLVGTLTAGTILEARFALVRMRAELTLTRISTEIDPATGLATAEGVLRVPDAQSGRILAGMNVRVFAARSTPPH